MIEAAILDLRLRIFNDSGPLFHHMSGIQTTSGRNSRAVQLMYLGLLVESGLVAPKGGAEQPATKTATVVPFPSSEVTRPEPATPDFLPDDLAATFG
ncbi:MAG TPA: hypothetical protein VLA64_09645 [Azonexus sp.]|nr:hypothetical protein [Azonexus sp.]